MRASGKCQKSAKYYFENDCKSVFEGCGPVEIDGQLMKLVQVKASPNRKAYVRWQKCNPTTGAKAAPKAAASPSKARATQVKKAEDNWLQYVKQYAKKSTDWKLDAVAHILYDKIWDGKRWSNDTGLMEAYVLVQSILDPEQSMLSPPGYKGLPEAAFHPLETYQSPEDSKLYKAIEQDRKMQQAPASAYEYNERVYKWQQVQR